MLVHNNAMLNTAWNTRNFHDVRVNMCPREGGGGEVTEWPVRSAEINLIAWE